MDAAKNKTNNAILRVLADAGEPISSDAISLELRELGVDLRSRMVRNYLCKMEQKGFVRPAGRRRREITDAGLRELDRGTALNKMELASARLDNLSYRMSLDPATERGTVVLNVSTFRASDLPRAYETIRGVLDRGLGMGRRVLIAAEGERLGGHHVAYGQAAVGTVSSVTMDGALRASGVQVYARFGGLLELRAGKPVRFVQLIHFDATTVDPVEMFLKSRMTQVRFAAESGFGCIGASFREIPAAALQEVNRVRARLRALQLDGILAIGRPGRPLLDVPVAIGRVGLVVAAGLNPIAAVEEAGIETRNYPMDVLHPVESLAPVERWKDRTLTSAELQARLASLAEQGGDNEKESFLFE